MGPTSKIVVRLKTAAVAYVFRVVNDSIEQMGVSFIEKFRKSRFIAVVVTKSPTSLDE